MANGRSHSEAHEAANAIYKGLIARVRSFEHDLEAGERLILRTWTAPEIQIERVGVSGETLVFWGFDADECQMMMVQHYSQLNVQVIAAPLAKGEERKPIGFVPIGDTEVAE